MFFGSGVCKLKPELLQKHLVIASPVPAQALKLDRGRINVLKGYAIAHALTAAVIVIPYHLVACIFEHVCKRGGVAGGVFVVMLARHIRKHAEHRHGGGSAAACNRSKFSKTLRI